MVGELPDVTKAGRLGFAREGDAIALVGWNEPPSLAAGELDKLHGRPLPDGLPEFDVDHVIATQAAIRDAVRAGDLTSAHDIAEGGFLVAVAEAVLAGGLGATLDLGPSADPFVHLFGERPGGFVVSGPRDALERLAERVPLDIFGAVGGDALHVDLGPESIEVPLTELRAAHAALAPLFP
jgi:phosphoribosylformylglycinamidine synthase